MASKGIPEGYERATPYLCVKVAAEALAFYAKPFGAVDTMRLAEPGGRIGHAEVRIGDARLLDPFGHRWLFAARKEDMSNDEMQRRYDRLFGQKSKA